MLKITDLTHSFDGVKVIDRLSLSFEDKGVYVIMGDSGCGKTTLLNVIAGLIKPDEGSVSFEMKSPKIAYMFQEPRLLPWLNARDNVNLALGGKKSTYDRASALLESVGLSDSAEKYPDELSGGMNQRVSFARALAYDSDLLLLDEPFNALDESNVSNMIGIIKELAAKKLVITVTHSREIAELLTDDIIIF